MIRSSRSHCWLTGLLVAALPLVAGAQTTEQNKGAFTATLTSFQTFHSTGSNGYRFIEATVHFRNNTTKPLILGYSRSGISASDEQGNRYGFVGASGMGAASGTEIDPKFVLAPQAGSDMLVELSWRGSSRDIFGITFDMNLAVREVTKLVGKQYELGPETAFEFTGLRTGFVSTPADVHVPDTKTVDAGPFTAKITRSKFGPSGRWRMISDLTVKITNTSDRPLILACELDSVHGSDDQGNVYGRGSASSTYIAASGIGLVNRDSADPQFTLPPGDSKDVHFTISRSERMDTPTEFNFLVALEELEILPSKQIREVRQYSLTFTKVKM